MKKIFNFILIFFAIMMIVSCGIIMNNNNETPGNNQTTEKVDVDFSKLTYTTFGDSITQGYDRLLGGNVQTPYPNRVKSILNLKSVDNKGIVNATLVTNQRGHECITELITSYTGEADIISVLGGINDYLQSLPLGDIDDTTQDTIYGALHVSMSYLKKNYPKAYIFYMTPYKCAYDDVYWANDNSVGVDVRDVVKAIKEVANIYNIDVLDLFNNGNFESIMYDEDCDGIHPNQDFIIDVMAPQIANFIKNNYK